MDMHMGRPDMGPTWDPFVLNFRYDFHISFNNSCSFHSTFNEYEFEYNNYILTRFGWMCIWDVLTWDPLGTHLCQIFVMTSIFSLIIHVAIILHKMSMNLTSKMAF